MSSADFMLCLASLTRGMVAWKRDDLSWSRDALGVYTSCGADKIASDGTTLDSVQGMHGGRHERGLSIHDTGRYIDI
jgi:hypothetical protein